MLQRFAKFEFLKVKQISVPQCARIMLAIEGLWMCVHNALLAQMSQCIQEWTEKKIVEDSLLKIYNHKSTINRQFF